MSENLLSQNQCQTNSRRKTALALEKINKSFRQDDCDLHILQEINLEIKNGEMVALTGPSGSGKTTILQIAGLLDVANSGKVIIDYQEIVSNNQSFSKEQQRQIDYIHLKKIGFIYQEHHLLPEFSAVENVAIPLLINKINKKEAIKKATAALIAVGLEEFANYQPNKLSGGQQQRVAIARAIVNRPKIILADEPTGNLDSQNAEIVFNLLESLVVKEQISCLLVTHNLDLANKANRQIKIKDGKISE